MKKRNDRLQLEEDRIFMQNLMEEQNRRNNRRDVVSSLGGDVGGQQANVHRLRSLNEEEEIKKGRTTGEVGGTNYLHDVPEGNEPAPT